MQFGAKSSFSIIKNLSRKYSNNSLNSTRPKATGTSKCISNIFDSSSLNVWIFSVDTSINNKLRIYHRLKFTWYFSNLLINYSSESERHSRTENRQNNSANVSNSRNENSSILLYGYIKKIIFQD